MTDERLCAVDHCGHPMPTGDNSTACPGCWNRLDVILGEIPWLVERLEETLARQSAVGVRNGGKGRETPLPYSTAASAALSLLASTLWPWVREGIEIHRDRLVIPPDLPTNAITLSRTLLRLRGWLITVPDGAAAIDEITYASKQAHRVIDLAPDRWYAGPCGAAFEDVECDAELYVMAGRPTVVCPVCGAEHDVVARRTQMLDQADDTLLTLTEMTRALALTGGETVSRKQLEGWVRRGRLVRSGNAGPVALYRVADVRDILGAVKRNLPVTGA